VAGPVRVLLATDGKEQAQTAQRLLTRFGRRNDGLAITVFGVASFGLALEEGMRVQNSFSPEAGRRYIKAVTQRAAEELRAAGFDAEPRVGHDDPSSRIIDLVDRERYALVVAGAGASRGGRMPVLGSTSTRVLHDSKASVLLVHEATADGDNLRVLLGTDGSGDAGVACRILMTVADPERVEVSVLSVSRPNDPPMAANAAPAAGLRERGLRRERAEQEATEAAEVLRSGGFRVRSEVIVGRPRDALVERATKGPFDIVAVGARGRGGVQQAILGSVSDSVARTARAALVARDRPETV
jgi:nucleotide-binding universal stress UspA family protein